MTYSSLVVEFTLEIRSDSGLRLRQGFEPCASMLPVTDPLVQQ